MDLTSRVDGEEFDETLKELLGILAELLELFRVEGPAIWLPELERDLELLRRHDGYGLTRFLSHFGSMGSIGDIGVGSLAEPLLSRAYLLARVLERSRG